MYASPKGMWPSCPFFLQKLDVGWGGRATERAESVSEGCKQLWVWAKERPAPPISASAPSPALSSASDKIGVHPKLLFLFFSDASVERVQGN